MWRVFLNGEDVSSRCQVADTGQGWVQLFIEESPGVLKVDHAKGEIAQKRVHGKVRLERRRDR